MRLSRRNRFEFFTTHSLYLKRKGLWSTADLIAEMADFPDVEVEGRRDLSSAREAGEWVGTYHF